MGSFVRRNVGPWGEKGHTGWHKVLGGEAVRRPTKIRCAKDEGEKGESTPFPKKKKKKVS